MSRLHSMPVLLCGLLVAAGGGFMLAEARQAGAAERSLYVMMYTTGPGWDTTLAPNAQKHFDVHSANLARLRRERALVAGGRFGPWGLILVDAESEAAARAMFAPDSSLSSGTFRGELHRWTTIYEGSIVRVP